MSLSEITFFERFEADILSGKKTITIRDATEKELEPGSIVQLSTFEDGRWFAAIKVISVVPVRYGELTTYHAKQENITLAELKLIIGDIYPNVDQLYVITFELVVDGKA
ncbi:N(4)-acetylcytidine aminohydrolase [Shewanella sp. Isolate11]|uniref:N(4)-acetylcytidine aminohydrolase n=1 Tax=Shewanella sp. Isolate11 TaxID=2908530 RepID=UPI001EFDC225|nr:N(4)-acetylcytidine aminohydrolase [Shewanella sp. Isolate11]MCG9696076.1 N(4)-acetylcytidine aminohydrolase [Shewanella sp. Isolate11]